MGRVADTCARLRDAHETAFLAYVTAGDPDPALTPDIIAALADNGADIVELGIPFSDPTADGPTIQLASERALTHPFSMPGIFDIVRKAREKTDVPILLFGYYNPIFVYGEERFAADAKAAGADGALVVDLPPEEGAGLREHLLARDLDIVYCVAPTSTPERLDVIGEASTGFVYAVSVTGVTGERESVQEYLEEYVTRIRAHTSLPVAVGFGITTPEHAATVGAVADGVVVGSALVSLIGAEGAQCIPGVSALARRLKEGAVSGKRGY